MEEEEEEEMEGKDEIGEDKVGLVGGREGGRIWGVEERMNGERSEKKWERQGREKVGGKEGG